LALRMDDDQLAVFEQVFVYEFIPRHPRPTFISGNFSRVNQSYLSYQKE
jgi:hypothetical protein